MEPPNQTRPDPADLLRRAHALAESPAPATRALAQMLLRLSRELQGNRP